MNADLRALREQEMMERELVQERMAKFWEPSKDEKKEVVNFLAVELMDETDLQELFFDLCAQDIDEREKVLHAARRLLIRVHAEICRHAENNKLPVTILTVYPEDARAMARGQM